MKGLKNMKTVKPIVPRTRRVRIVKSKAKKAEKGFHKKMYSVHHPENGVCYGVVKHEKNVSFDMKKGENVVNGKFVVYLFRNASVTSEMSKGSHLAVDEEMSQMASMQRIVTNCKTNQDAIALVPQLCGVPATKRG